MMIVVKNTKKIEKIEKSYNGEDIDDKELVWGLNYTEFIVNTLYFHCNFCFCGTRYIFGFHGVNTTVISSCVSDKEAGRAKNISYFHVHSPLNFNSIFEPSYSWDRSSLNQSFDPKTVSRLNNKTIEVLRAKFYCWWNCKRTETFINLA